MKKTLAFLDKYVNPGIAVVVLFIIAGLFYYPVIKADVLFQDDAERATTESAGHGFIEGGRFVSEALSRVMSGLGEYPVDYGSLGQVLGVVSVVFAVALLLRYKLDFSVRSILAVSPLIINPFLLHNISYRFDSFGMLLGYALAIASFALFKRNPQRFGFSILLLLVSFGFYQSMPNIFLMLAALKFITSTARAKQSVFASSKILILQGASYAAALLLFLLTTAYVFPLTNTRNQASLNLESIPENIQSVVQLLSSYFQGAILATTVLSLVISIYVLAIYTYRKKDGFLRLGLIAIGILLLLSTLLGPMLFAENAIIFPRSLSSVTLFALLPGAALLLAPRRSLLQIILAVLLVVIMLQTLLFSYTYGAFLKHQSDYQQLLLWSAYTSIQANGIDGTFYVVGLSDQPVSSKKIMERYPILVENYWKAPALNNPSWTERLLKNYGINAKVDWTDDYPDKQEVICSQNIQPVIEARNYVIYTLSSNSKSKDEQVIFFRPDPKEHYCE